MADLRKQLEHVFAAPCAVVGVGNVDYGDDGVGVRLAEGLLSAGCSHVFVTGTTPENRVMALAREGFQRILFLDAVEFGGAPGSVVLLNAREMQQRFPQVSTHKISLGTLAGVLEQEHCEAWLLGIQPQKLKSGALSSEVQTTVALMHDLLLGIMVSEVLQP
jgi:hydrogenase maturation protease